jgi:hypothetical protein
MMHPYAHVCGINLAAPVMLLAAGATSGLLQLVLYLPTQVTKYRTVFPTGTQVLRLLGVLEPPAPSKLFYLC